MRTISNDKLKTIEAFIDHCREQTGVIPTVQEIEAGTDIPYATVGRYLKLLRKDGVIEYNGPRTYVTPKARRVKESTCRVPVLGSVACGLPKLAEENIEEYVLLPEALFGRGDFFILRAKGDSMIEVGIDDGDLVVIRQQNTANPGQIVVALMEDEATLKRYYPEPENHQIRLHPENSSMEDIYVDNCIIQGVAVKVLKDLE